MTDETESKASEHGSKDKPPASADGGGPLLTPPSVGVMARGMVRSVRPHQWVKNLFVLAPVVFAKHLTHPSIIISAVGAFGVFCLLAGAIYTLNDLLDVEADRIHPVKRHRPIASGAVPEPVAKVLIAVLLVAAFGGALLGPRTFLVVAASYFVLNTAYSLRLKRFAYIDVSCIAGGFVLRVLAGNFATKTDVSLYMIACTAFLALFLGFGKRRHELSGEEAVKQRAALGAYTKRSLFWALAITGFAAVATYLAYTRDPYTRKLFRSEWLWITTIHPLFGVLRFLHLVKNRPEAESPTQEMLRDTPFVLNVVVWIVEVIMIVYRLRPT